MQMGCEACLHFYCKKANVCRDYWRKEVTGEYFSIYASFWQAEQNNLSLELRILELSSTFRRKFGG